MAGDIVVAPSANQIAPGAKIENSIRIAFSPADATLDALAKLRPARDWLADRAKRDPNHNDLMLDFERFPAYELADTARERLALIPDQPFLDHAKQLFHAAEHDAAPTAWYALAFTAMLAAAPNTKNIGPDYVHGLIYSLKYDEDLWQGYGQGFSCPVVVSAILQMRREQSFIPGSAELLQACQKHRRRFRDLGRTMDVLTWVRENAQEVLAEDKRQYAEDFGDDDDGQIIPPRPPGWDKSLVDADVECPF